MSDSGTGERGPLNLALAYMDALFNEEDPEKLRPLLAVDFRFDGPLFSCHDAESYIAALAQSPPDQWRYTLIKTEEAPGACRILYRFSKPGVEAIMEQTFTIEEGKIVASSLHFDPSLFDTP